MALVANDKVVNLDSWLSTQDIQVVPDCKRLERGNVDDSARRVLATSNLTDDRTPALAQLARFSEQRRAIILNA